MEAATSRACKGDREPEAVCYSCQTPLGADVKVCPVCGHRQYRVCYCGEQLQPEVGTCPNCTADWSQSSRVRSRRKSRSHGSVRDLVRSAASGAIIFAAICELLYLAGGRAAQAMGEDAPADVLVRLSYLGKAVAATSRLISGRALCVAGNGHLLQLLGLLMAGAALGALWYLLQHNRWLRTKLGVLKSRRHRRAA